MDKLIPMPEQEYHADPCPEPSLSSGIIKVLMNQSPRHAWFAHPRLNQAKVASEPTSDKEFGSACHALLLEADESRLVEVNADDWRTKAAQEKRNEARAAGQTALLSHRVADAYAMVAVARAAISMNEDLEGIFIGAQAEHVMTWQQDGTWNRARPDLYNPAGRGRCMDYKTSGTSAEPGAWTSKQLTAMGYDIQAAHYLDGFQDVTGSRPAWFWLVQENTEPFECSIIGAGEGTLDLGSQKVIQARNIWRHCLKNDSWPGYPTQTCWSEPPSCEISKWEERKTTQQMIDNATELAGAV